MDAFEQLILQQQKDAKAAELQRKGMIEEQIMAEAARASKDPSVDLSSLAALNDQFTGGNLGAAVSQQAQRQGANSAYDDKRIDDLFDGLISNTGSGVAKAPAGMAADAKQDRQDNRFDISRVEGYTQNIIKDFGKENRLLSEFDTSFTGIENALASGKYERVMGQLAPFARSINAEKGTLAEGDIGRTYITTLDNDIQKWMIKFGDKTGDMDPNDLKNLADAIKDSRAKLGPVFNQRLEGLKETYASSPYGAQAIQRMGDKGLVKRTIDLSGAITKSDVLDKYYKEVDGENAPPAKTALERAKERLAAGSAQ